MGMLSKPAFGPRVALIYVTIGSLLDVWTGVWYFFQVRGHAQTEESSAMFWVTGLFLTGLTLIFLGLILGPLGQYARKAELPPVEAEHREQSIQQTAAAVPQVVAPGVPPGTAAAGQALAAPPANPAYPAPPVRAG